MQSVRLTERQCGWDTHAAGHISAQPYNTDLHRYRQGGPPNAVCLRVGVCDSFVSVSVLH